MLKKQIIFMFRGCSSGRWHHTVKKSEPRNDLGTLQRKNIERCLMKFPFRKHPTDFPIEQKS